MIKSYFRFINQCISHPCLIVSTFSFGPHILPFGGTHEILADGVADEQTTYRDAEDDTEQQEGDPGAGRVCPPH